MSRLLPDEPTSVDKLGYEVFAKGLVDLILDCDTPFTIGIHGKWGAGKTSLMTMIRKELLSDRVGKKND